MFKYFAGVLYGFALLSDQFVMFFGAHLSLYCVPFDLACGVNLRRCFPSASGDGIVLVEGW